MDNLFDEVQQACSITGLFELRSGIVSDHYFDKYKIQANPNLFPEVCWRMVDLLPKGIDVVAGIELGSIAFATGVALITRLPLATVRKERKNYGTRNLIEGATVTGKKVLLIEDIITSGTQAILSAEYLRDEYATVEDIICITIRTTSYKETMLKHGLAVQYLFDWNGVDHVS